MNEELLYAKLQCTIKELAHESLGIYCKTIINADGSKTERTPWQDGWNAAIIADSKAQKRIINFFKTLTNDVIEAIVSLHAENLIWLHCDKDKPIELFLNMNDTFYYASADDEEIKISEVLEVYELWKKYSHHGIIAWVAKNRKIEPIVEWQTPEYEAAKKELFSK